MSVPIVRLGRGWFVFLAVALFAAPAPGQADPSGVTWDERIEVASGGGYRLNRFRYPRDSRLI